MSAAEDMKAERQEVTHLGSLFAARLIQAVEQRIDFFPHVAREPAVLRGSAGICPLQFCAG